MQFVSLHEVYIGVLRDTDRAPKPTTQYHAIPRSYDPIELGPSQAKKMGYMGLAQKKMG